MTAKLPKLLILPLLAVLIAPQPAVAQGLLPACAQSGNCGFCDILSTGVNIFRYLLGSLGGISLLLFVWHAFGWITSGGNKEKIEASKKALVHTLIGLVIILASWFLVNLTIMLLVTPVDRQSDNVFSQSLFGDTQKWYEYCKDE
ncbi:MAG TPA: pilin [Patescibacteria group bacterium]|nr:pilin [Patescibacteria group bacterium]